ncbi:hypothetical protein H5S09_06910 [Limosilactobacillus sp. STM2_1]|uniref:Uncharacterized protein n=1 Tax=Limosilactobacillus rudii TaxID=2759755 RepID=A0A7W3UMM1_9LACO|nr:hypothetical protein [Limosilactobacillus rudii]MBB1078778.1 hypothetical protein [Limosilactobacillus rudii]MBB1097670.1 hypothetical protein [Limosilactobacillus rudii]MCD7134778.1 hypothetical protein [Limosilactobacillus rudii]
MAYQQLERFNKEFHTLANEFETKVIGISKDTDLRKVLKQINIIQYDLSELSRRVKVKFTKNIKSTQMTMDIQRQKIMVIRKLKELVDLIQEKLVKKEFKDINCRQLTEELLNFSEHRHLFAKLKESTQKNASKSGDSSDNIDWYKLRDIYNNPNVRDRIENECKKADIKESEIIEQYNNKDKTADLIKQIFQVEALRTQEVYYKKVGTSDLSPIYIGFNKKKEK